ncbi:aspartyl protease family protein 2-like, partial [Impatiens glandulifera]|uniref:aspartyl protease family protein 2-like n=1 Tax=Impatiens glandulifera TaxID=253017 RepID=UPI001FB0F020
LYPAGYGDGSFSSGDFVTETLTFHSTKIPNIAVGCGHDNQVLSAGESGAAGVLGLGAGGLSFPSQAGPTINHKFSYCLVDRSSSSSKPSFLIFGNFSISRTAIFTPLLTNDKQKSFYYLDLIGFSVEGKRVAGISPQLFKLDSSGDGGVIIDSGTFVTRLTNKAYVQFRNAFRSATSDLKPARKYLLFDTCFDFSGMKSVNAPNVVLHFANANVSLPAENYLIPVDSAGKFCFAFIGSPGKMSIIGNIQQQGFRVVFDLKGSRVGFSPGGCK